MDTEIKTAFEAVNTAFAQFKEADAAKWVELEKKGHVDPVLLEKVERINGVVGELQAAHDKLATAFKRHPSSEEDESKAAVVMERKALREFARKGGMQTMADFINSHAEFKAMSVGSDPDGGFTVLPDTSGQMVKKIFETSPIRQIASVQTISTDALKGSIDKDEATQGWVAETAARTETNTPQLGEWVIRVHEQYAAPKATQQLLDDSAVNIESWLAEKVADKFARVENTAFVSGDGITKPKGFTSYNTSATADSTRGWGTLEHVATGTNGAFGTSTLGSEKLITLVHKLKSGYRQNATWVMNREAVGEVRKLKGGDGAYIWLPSMQSGQPSTLLGYSILEAEDMPAYSTTDALALAFGNFKVGYQIVDRQGVRVLRDPYTSKPNVIFYSTKRTGADILNFEAIKFLKMGS